MSMIARLATALSLGIVLTAGTARAVPPEVEKATFDSLYDYFFWEDEGVSTPIAEEDVLSYEIWQDQYEGEELVGVWVRTAVYGWYDYAAGRGLFECGTVLSKESGTWVDQGSECYARDED
jgi:hypothetical protein